MINQQSWQKLQLLSELATWGELDLDIKEDAIMLNGMTLAEDESPLFLGAFSNQSPVKMELHEMMPSGTSYFLHMGISSPSGFQEQMERYLSGAGKWDGIAAELERLDRLYGIDPLDDLVNLMDDELAWFALEGETT